MKLCVRVTLARGQNVRHPQEMAEPEIDAFLTHLAVKEKVSASTQNQALSALLFLYRNVIVREVGDLGEVIRANFDILSRPTYSKMGTIYEPYRNFSDTKM